METKYEDLQLRISIDLYAKLGGEGEISHSGKRNQPDLGRLTFPRTGFLKSFLLWGYCDEN